MSVTFIFKNVRYMIKRGILLMLINFGWEPVKRCGTDRDEAITEKKKKIIIA